MFYMIQHAVCVAYARIFLFQMYCNSNMPPNFLFISSVFFFFSAVRSTCVEVKPMVNLLYIVDS